MKIFHFLINIKEKKWDLDRFAMKKQRKAKNTITVKPRGTRPHGTRTSLGHDFKKGSKILAGHDFGHEPRGTQF